MAASDERYTKKELALLKELAEKYCAGAGTTRCEWLYRNKSPKYFEEILRNEPPIMRVELKDNGGDRRNPINAMLKGLFFSPTVEWGRTDATPRLMSAFGSRRCLIPIDKLTRSTDLYFSDFYCMQNPAYHYVILVMANRYTRVNEFCKQNLLELRYDDSNPFFNIENGAFMTSRRANMMVEVFYTDDINLNAMKNQGMKWQDVQTFGRGQSTPGGLPKNPTCHYCNLKYN